MTYHQGFLYLSDGRGNPVEVINEARTAANLQRAIDAGDVTGFYDVADLASCEALAFQPCTTTSPVEVAQQASAFNDAILWLDPQFGIEGELSLQNKGTGGAALNAQYGSTSVGDSAEPALLLHEGYHYVWLPGVSGNYLYRADASTVDVTGDLELVFCLELTDWTPGSTTTLMAKYGAAGQRSWRWYIDTSGNMVLEWSANGTTLISKTSTASLSTVFGERDRYFVKVTLDVNNGAAGNDVKFYYGATADPDPTVEPTFTQLGSTVTTASTTSIFNSTSVVEIGSTAAGTANLGAMKVFRAIVRNGIGGTTVFDFDPSYLTSAEQTTIVERGAAATVNIVRGTSNRMTAVVVRSVLVLGSDDYLEIADSALFDFGSGTDFTVLAAIRQWGTTAGVNRPLMTTQSVVTSGKGWSLYNAGGVEKANRFQSRDGAGNSVTSGDVVITAGELTVLAAVRSGLDHDLSATVAGVIESRDSASATPLDTTNSNVLRIGVATGSANAWEGEILTLAIWDRALTDAELTEYSALLTARATADSIGYTSEWEPMDTDLTAAPWYVSGSAASSETIGFYIQEWTGLDDGQITRSMEAVFPRGGVASALAQPGRTFAFNLLVLGTSERGLLHLMRWLQGAIMSCYGSCDTMSLWLREYCPDDPVSAPEEGLVRVDGVSMLRGPVWESPPVADSGCFFRVMSLVLGVADPCFYGTAEDFSTSTVLQADLGSSTTTSVAQAGRWVGTNAHVTAALPTPAVGLLSPIVTISFDRTGTVTPQIRIVGYENPAGLSASEVGQMYPIGGLVLSGATPGMEVKVDFGKRQVLYRDLANSRTWQDGSALIYLNHDIFNADGYSPAAKSRWISFDNCSNPLVVVDPYRLHGGYYDEDNPVTGPVDYPGDSASLCDSYTVDIDYAERHGCY